MTTRICYFQCQGNPNNPKSERKKIKVQGFIIFDDFGHFYPDFAEEMRGWIGLPRGMCCRTPGGSRIGGVGIIR